MTPANSKATGKELNIWMIVSIVLALALIVMIGVVLLKTNLVGKSQSAGGKMIVLSADQASDKLLKFINEVYGPQVGLATLKGATEANGLYEVTVGITDNGQPVDQKIYVTKDGALFIPQAMNIDDITQQFRTFQAQQQQGAAGAPSAQVPTAADQGAAAPTNPEVIPGTDQVTQ